MRSGSPQGRAAVCRRILLIELLLVLAALAAAPFAGRLAYAEDPLAPGDAILALAGEHTVRWLEAGDLRNEGWAPKILLSAGYRERAERELSRRGIRIPSEGEVARDALLQMGHPEDSVEVMPGYPDNTAAEGVLLREKALSHAWSQVIVVTSKLHSRRAGFAIRRELRGSGVTIIMRTSRHDDDDPARWWTKRRTARMLLSELPKLLAYLVGMRD
jgi:uncharacterized SAM-binding protein YcdF (DUF218 family)